VFRHRIRNKKIAKSADFLINRRARRAFCCAFPAILLPGGAKTGLQGEDLLEVEPLVSRSSFLPEISMNYV
jgi:hypothetical protein